MGDHSDEKRVCRLGDVRELHRPLPSIDCAKFARDWLACRHDLQKLFPSRFLHRLAVVEKPWKFKISRKKLVAPSAAQRTCLRHEESMEPLVECCSSRGRVCLKWN
jgi:hypothetical protein